jgi:Actin-fragmin kinase, catalytic
MTLPETPDRLVNLGKILACDIFMNNNDRIPAMFEGHQGNTKNLMFQVENDDKCDE